MTHPFEGHPDEDEYLAWFAELDHRDGPWFIHPDANGANASTYDPTPFERFENSVCSVFVDLAEYAVTRHHAGRWRAMRRIARLTMPIVGVLKPRVIRLHWLGDRPPQHIVEKASARITKTLGLKGLEATTSAQCIAHEDCEAHEELGYACWKSKRANQEASHGKDRQTFGRFDG